MTLGRLRLALVVSCAITLLCMLDGIPEISTYYDNINEDDYYTGSSADGDNDYGSMMTRSTIRSNLDQQQAASAAASAAATAAATASDDFDGSIHPPQASAASSSSSSSSSATLIWSPTATSTNTTNTATQPQPSSSLLPPIYWINLDTSLDRREAMQAMLTDMGIPHDQHQRIPAITVEEAKELWELKELRLHPKVKLTEKDGTLSYLKHAKNIYEFPEAACLLSHFQAILAAYQDGHEMALILEDDALLSHDFIQGWKNLYLEKAPLDWKILQFATNNHNVIRQGATIALLEDYFVTWQPYHWSTRAYLINRNGMERILKATHSISKNKNNSPSTPADGRTIWSVRQIPMVVADEVLYYLVGNSYTSMGLWVDSANFGSTIQSNNAHQNLSAVLLLQQGDDKTTNANTNTNTSSIINDGSNALPSTSTSDNENNVTVATTINAMERRTKTAVSWMNSSSVLVLMNLRIRTRIEIQTELDWIQKDHATICPFFPTTKGGCVWEIHAVLASSSLVELFQKAIKALFSSATKHEIRFHIQVGRGPFNKFAYLRTLVDKMKDYDRVLFKDNDQRLNGLAWKTFWDRTGNATVSGPLRQNVDEALLHQLGAPQRQYFQFHSARAWTSDWHTKWSANYYAKVVPIEVPMLEMYFVLMDGRFAHWFFDLILTPEFLNQTSAWGPDFLWCSAAKEWDPNRPSCLLIPVTSTHEDTRQIAKNNAEHSLSGFRMTAKFRENPVFDQWMRPAANWTKMIGEKQLFQIEKACRELLKMDDGAPFDLVRCTDKMYHLLEEDVSAITGAEKAGTGMAPPSSRATTSQGRSRERRGRKQQKSIPVTRAILITFYLTASATYLVHYMFNGNAAPTLPPTRTSRFTRERLRHMTR